MSELWIVDTQREDARTLFLHLESRSCTPKDISYDDLSDALSAVEIDSLSAPLWVCIRNELEQRRGSAEIARLRVRFPTPLIKFVLVTSEMSQDAIEQHRQSLSPADAYLRLPLDAADLDHLAEQISAAAIVVHPKKVERSAIEADGFDIEIFDEKSLPDFPSAAETQSFALRTQMAQRSSGVGYAATELDSESLNHDAQENDQEFIERILGASSLHASTPRSRTDVFEAKSTLTLGLDESLVGPERRLALLRESLKHREDELHRLRTLWRAREREHFEREASLEEQHRAVMKLQKEKEAIEIRLEEREEEHVQECRRYEAKLEHNEEVYQAQELQNRKKVSEVEARLHQRSQELQDNVNALTALHDKSTHEHKRVLKEKHDLEERSFGLLRNASQWIERYQAQSEDRERGRNQERKKKQELKSLLAEYGHRQNESYIFQQKGDWEKRRAELDSAQNESVSQAYTAKTLFDLRNERRLHLELLASYEEALWELERKVQKEHILKTYQTQHSEAKYADLECRHTLLQEKLGSSQDLVAAQSQAADALQSRLAALNEEFETEQENHRKELELALRQSQQRREDAANELEILNRRLESQEKESEALSAELEEKLSKLGEAFTKSQEELAEANTKLVTQGESIERQERDLEYRQAVDQEMRGEVDLLMRRSAELKLECQERGQRVDGLTLKNHELNEKLKEQEIERANFEQRTLRERESLEETMQQEIGRLNRLYDRLNVESVELKRQLEVERTERERQKRIFRAYRAHLVRADAKESEASSLFKAALEDFQEGGSR